MTSDDTRVISNSRGYVEHAEHNKKFIRETK